MSLFEKLTLLMDFLGSLLEAGGVVLAAKIGVSGLNTIAQKHFDNYRDKNHNLSRLLAKAESEITVVAEYGNKLLEEYATVIENRMRHGVVVRYLMLTTEAAEKMDRDFLCVNGIHTREEVEKVREKLRTMQSVGEIEVREWNLPLTASYIGIDLNYSFGKSESALQVMTYLYKTETKASPISYLTYKEDYNRFSTTVNSINQMWDNAIPVTEKTLQICD